MAISKRARSGLRNLSKGNLNSIKKAAEVLYQFDFLGGQRYAEIVKACNNEIKRKGRV
jgi:hypothetical protein